MSHDQQDLAHIIDQLAGGDMTATQLADLSDDQLATIGRKALQRRGGDPGVIGEIAALLNQGHGKSWRAIAELFGQKSHMTIYRWAQPYVEGTP